MLTMHVRRSTHIKLYAWPVKSYSEYTYYVIVHELYAYR